MSLRRLSAAQVYAGILSVVSLFSSEGRAQEASAPPASGDEGSAFAEPQEVPIPDDEGIEPPSVSEPQPAPFNPLETNPSQNLWQASVRASYFGAFEEADPVGLFIVNVGRELGNSYSLFLEQALAINFVSDASKDGLEIQDTNFGVSRDLPAPFKDSEWSASFQLSLPISRDSRFQEIYTMPEIGSELSLAPNSWYKPSFGASLAWLISAYETAPGEDGEGGEALPLFSLNLSHASRFELSEFWRASISLLYSETLYHAIEHEAVGDPALYELPNQGYRFEIGISRRISIATRASLSFSQGSTLLQPGIDDYVIYDSSQSRWTLGLSHIIK